MSTTNSRLTVAIERAEVRYKEIARDERELSISRTRMKRFHTISDLAGFTASVMHMPRRGFIYILFGNGDWYKIGGSAQPVKRIQQIQTQLPFPVQTFLTFEHYDHVAAEQYLHLRFAAVRLNGEWFNLTDDDIATIRDFAAYPGSIAAWVRRHAEKALPSPERESCSVS